MHPYIAAPATLALVVRAYTRNSLTLPGILFATLTAIIHALHPSPIPFTLLVVFFLLGTTATKVKHEVKATLTLSSTGGSGGEGPRSTIQVLANSGAASLLCLFHVLKYGTGHSTGDCFSITPGQNAILLGIIGNYAAVTADTLSSELGILSKGKPRLVTTLQSVPSGTNGGVTAGGVLAGAAGSAVIGLVSALLLTFCDHNDRFPFWTILDPSVRGGVEVEAFWVRLRVVLATTAWGTLGSLLDSLLGAVLQASVVDRRTGKIVEGAGGKKVLVVGSRPPASNLKKTDNEVSRSISSGRDVLDNNQINFLMASIMTIGAMVIGDSINWILGSL